MQGVLDCLVPVPRGIDDRLVERGAEGLKSLAGGVFAASAEAVTEFAVQTGGFRIVPSADLGRIGGELGDIGPSGGFKQLDQLGLVLFAKPLAKAGSRDVQGWRPRSPASCGSRYRARQAEVMPLIATRPHVPLFATPLAAEADLFAELLPGKMVTRIA